MKKMLKVFAAFAALVCLLLSFGALAACGDNKNGTGNGENKVTYSVTVTSSYDETIFGAEFGIAVQIKDADGNVVAEKPIQKEAMTFSLPAATYTVSLKDPQTALTLLNLVYTEATLTDSSRSATIAVIPESEAAPKIDYYVTLQYPDGTPAANVTMELCGGANGAFSCSSAVTNAQGVATFQLQAGDYDVHVQKCPAGYTFNNDQYKMHSEGGKLTVKLIAQ